MRKRTTAGGADQRLYCDIGELQILFGLGRTTAQKVAEEAGACVRVGTRRIYNISKMQEFLEGKKELETV